MIDFSLQWHIEGPGSAIFSLVLPGETVDVHATYTGDGLGSILQAAVDLQGGSSSAIAYLHDEPGGTFLFFAGAGDDVNLQIVGFQNMELESRRWTGGGLRWHGRIDVRRFVSQATIMAEEALTRCGGEEAYAMAWSGIAFPTEKLALLQKRRTP